ncbi:MAG: DUF302 domain-containing protein [Chromatiales bacterium]|nr:DUF302 domain-containing protein [Chromatiales bacterium]
MSFDVSLPLGFDAAVEQVTAALKAEGFGVLTRADVHVAFREKIGRTFRPYTILGACNPPLAFDALSARPEAGLLLPCNVIVEEVEPGRSLVRIVDPDAMMRAAGFEQDPVLARVGGDAGARLKRVAAALAG